MIGTRERAEARLRAGDLALLALLKRAEHPPTQEDMARALGLTQPGIAYRLGKLEAAEMIVWRRGSARGVSLTPRGRRCKT